MQNCYGTMFTWSYELNLSRPKTEEAEYLLELEVAKTSANAFIMSSLEPLPFYRCSIGYIRRAFWLGKTILIYLKINIHGSDAKHSISTYVYGIECMYIYIYVYQLVESRFDSHSYGRNWNTSLDLTICYIYKYTHNHWSLFNTAKRFFIFDYWAYIDMSVIGGSILKLTKYHLRTH